MAGASGRSTKRPLATQTTQVIRLGLVLATLCAVGAEGAWAPAGQQRPRHSAFAARRAADDSRPLVRISAAQPLSSAESQESAVVLGRFRAPAPERVLRQRVPKSSQMAAQTLAASFQVAEPEALPVGPGQQQRQRQRPDQRTVGATMQVSDEGLNYPPSKLSADIYGNVAEIVTAPPEAAESDFLVPNSRRFAANRP